MNPSNKKAQLAYVLMMTTIDGEWGAGDWKAHVEFAKPPPDCLKIFPEGGKVAKIDGKLAVVLTCDDEDLCEDGTVIISALQFTPRKGKEKSGRALVIHQDAQAQRAAELSSRALVHKEEWTGTEVDVEFSKNSPDMKNAVSQPYSDFAGPGLVGNVSKSFFEISFVQTEGSQIVYNASADKIQMFGFTSGTSGLQNSNANRIWSGEPSKGTSKLVYGIIMTDVKGPAAWEYNIEFVKPPPQDKFKIFPPDGKVGKANGNLFVAMTCEEPEGEGECHDGKILISGAQFRRMDKKLIKNPEEVKVVATPPPGISS